MKKVVIFVTSVALCVALFAIINGIAGGVAPAVDEVAAVANPATERRDGFVIVAEQYEGIFSPIWSKGETDALITRLVFEPLVEEGADGSVIARLADYTVSPDGLTYTFTIKDDAAFSNGQPVTTDDIAFTWDVITDPSYDGNINLSDLMAYNIVDEQTITATMESDRGSALYDLGISPLSRAYYGLDYTTGQLDYVRLQSSRPMGCGLYMVGDYTMDSITLSANEEYHGEEPFYESVTFTVGADAATLMTTGAADIDLTGADMVGDIIERVQIPTDSMGILGFNMEREPLNNPVVRQAISMCVDREALIEAGLDGMGSALYVPTAADGFAGEGGVSTYNPEAARAMLAEAGLEGLELDYTITEGNPVSKALGEMLSTSLAEAGITLNVDSMDYASLLRHVELGRSDMWFMAWGLRADADISPLVFTDGHYNYFNYSDSVVDSLLPAVQGGSLTERTTAASRLWQELEADIPFIVLYQGAREINVNIRVPDIEFSTHTLFVAELFE